jgi:hypothetical protein
VVKFDANSTSAGLRTEGEFGGMSPPTPADFETPVRDLKGSDIFLSTITEGSREEAKSGRGQCLFCGTWYRYRPGTPKSSHNDSASVARHIWSSGGPTRQKKRKSLEKWSKKSPQNGHFFKTTNTFDQCLTSI